MTNLYDTAIRIWIARKVSSTKYFIDAEAIEKYEFGEDNHGACPTCDDPFVCIHYWLKPGYKRAKFNPHSIDIEGTSPVELVQECIEIYKTLNHLGDVRL